VIYINTVRIKLFSGAVAKKEEDFCKGSFARTSFTLFIVLFTLFLLHHFIKNTKKISFLLVAFTCLLLALLE
jgi:hypothetical protein